MEKLIQELGAKIDSIKESGATKEEFTALKNSLSEFSKNEDFLKFKTDVENLEKELKDLIQDSKKEEKKVTFQSEVEKNIVGIKSIAKGEKGEVEIKALTNRASVTGNTNAYVLPDIGQLGVKARALYDALPKFQLPMNGNDNGVLKYHDWDEATTVRAAEVVAEGGTFDESTAKFQEYTLPLRKIGDTLPVTEEFGEDVALAAAELEAFLDVNVQTKIDSQIIVGDNTGQELKGLLVSVPTYTPVEEGIPSANIKDLARRMRTAIVKPRGSKYNPDVIIANSDTIDKYVLAKDKNDNYLFLESDGRIAGLTIVEDNNMPDNQLVVGDRRFARIYEKGGVVISEGLVNAQFTSDTKTLKARKRLAMLIRNVDATGFLKCTDIETALETLAEVPTP